MKRKRWTVLAVFAMVVALLPLNAVPAAGTAAGSDLIITGVIDGPLSGGVPKAVEFYAINDVTDLTNYGFGSANNGGGTDGEEFTFPTGSVSAGEFIYVATETSGFTDFFGFAPNHTSSAAGINGDDAIELFMNGSVVDVFGDINTDGTGQPWEYMDGWAYRVDGTGPDGSTFVLGNWVFSGPNALDGETSNATATTPFPAGSYTSAGANAPVVVSCSDIVTDEGVAATSVVEASDADGVVEILELIVDPVPASGDIALDAIVPATTVGEAATAQVSVDAAVPAGSYDVTVTATNNDATRQTGTCQLSVTVVSATTVSIHDIQYTTDLSGDSPYKGQTVATEGVVTAVFGNNAFIQDGTGPWSGLYLYNPSPVPAVGNVVRVQGQVKEYYGKTEIDGVALWDMGPGTLPAPEVLATGNIAAEKWESVFVRAENATVTNADLGYGEWSVDDGSGPVRVDDLGSYGYVPYTGDLVTFVQGPLDYSYGTFKIEPRDDRDLFVDLSACGLRYTPIYDIQGSGDASPIVGSTVWTEGVVTADFQESGELNGFFLQDATGDGDATTSDGVFVYQKAAWGDVEVGQHLRFQAKVSEYYGLTELGYVSNLTVCGAGSVTPTVMPMPLEEREPYEGMLVTFPQTLTISEYYNFDRYGEIVLTTDRQFQATSVFEPGSTEAGNLKTANALARITLDDGRGDQNPDPARHPNGAPFTLSNRFRGGDTVTNVTGVVDYSHSKYRIQPTTGADYTAVNLRPETPPDVGGSLKVASFNVLNFFTHIDDGTNDICGPTGDQECRGADTAEEFQRQLDKIVAGIMGTGADVVGLQEVENDIRDDEPVYPNRKHDAILTLVKALNAADGAGTWAWVGEASYYNDYPVRNEIIYRTATVAPDGTAIGYQDVAFDKKKPGSVTPVGRPPLAQTFTEKTTGEQFTVVVNHFKSKGSSCASISDPYDPDQANCNLTRVAQSQALLDFVSQLEAIDPDVLVIGDLNSYAKEDPVDVLIGGGFTNLHQLFEGTYAYSYVYDGQLGYLDHALANESLLPQVTGTAAWHINADEPDILNYDMTYKKPAQDALYEPNAFRASDHDPVVVGLQLDSVPPVVKAEFQHLRGRMFTGLYRVRYSCEDAVDPNPTCEGVINGSIPVDDGQLVFLIRAPGRSWHKAHRSVLIIKAPSFELAVTSTDAAGNTATATAEPKFRHRHHRH